ncbi:hypothetical protein UPYG_G00257850 [Umbra pygmaea]|uniref:Large ribosomal subunit protein uL23m n=1 Tax=Umbra pygmaea TaxID=75934 RepID=A0ABD0W8P4_UMBPY
MIPFSFSTYPTVDRMTKFDVRNYLEKIYNIPVGAVRTRIQYGTNKKRNHLNQKLKRPDYKLAYVQLQRPEEKGERRTNE